MAQNKRDVATDATVETRSAAEIQEAAEKEQERLAKNRANPFNEDNTPGFRAGAAPIGYFSEGMRAATPGGKNANERMGLLEMAKAMVTKQREAAAEKERKAHQITWGYVACRHCEGPAIWLSNYIPGQRLTEDNWRSSYKAHGEPFNGRIPYCQVCDFEQRRLPDGRRIPVRLLTSGADSENYWPRSYDIRELSKEEFELYSNPSVELTGGIK